MGVMTCDRKGCDNIMCDLVSTEFGYICNDCFREMKELLGESASWKDIKSFMNDNKKESKTYNLEKEFEVPTCE